MKFSYFLLTLCTLFLIFALLIFPKEMLSASFDSVSLWFHMVLPSLFPFLVATDMLVRLGVAETAGKALQPVMKVIWGLPGISAFPFLMGLISGYPVGAKITATLCEEGSINTKQAQHLLCFCNNPGPLFVIGTVGTAMLKNPMYGYFIMVCILLSCIMSGILFRIISRKEDKNKKIVLKKRKKYTESIGTLMGKSIRNSLKTIAQIGGFIVLFGVFLRAIELTKILIYISYFLENLFPFSMETINCFLSGLLEMTNGAALFCKLDCSSYLRIIGITILLAFGGFSILGQTLSILSNISINTYVYVFSKIVNSILAGIFAAILYPYWEELLPQNATVFAFISENTFHFQHYLLCNFLFLIAVIFYAIYKLKPYSKKQ